MNSTARRPGGDKFPCASLAEALPHLRRPPSPVAVQFKIQNAVDEAAQVAAYIDARLVFDRLDRVCGHQWAAAFDELPDALIPAPVDRNGELREPPPVYVRCRLTLYGVTREDVGEGQDPKAAFSDAIKRAAVHFGVGRALYAMRLPWLREGDAESELRRNSRGKLVLDRRTEDWCREMYERWLAERGRRQFGEPLDHGDESGAPGFEREGTASGLSGESPALVPEASPATDGVDQGQGRGHLPRPQPGRTSEQASGRGNCPVPLDRRTPERSPTVVGPLRAVTDGRPPSLASAHQQIAKWRHSGRYKHETVAALARLLFGERIERLSRDQVRDVGLSLEFAVRGRIAQRTLAGAITRLSKRDDRAEAAKALRAWLTEKANERELLGRRRAA